MNNNVDYKEGLIFTIFNYITWFVLANIYFLVTNILFIGYIITFGLDITSNVSVLLLVSLIPMGPALTALCASMGKIIREKDINITRYYFNAYKINFKQSLIIWSTELIIFFVSYIDLKVVANGNVSSSFAILFLLICIFTIALSTIAFPIVSRFELKIIDVLKLSFIYSIKKFHVVIINMITIVIGFCLVYILPGTVFLCLISLICFSIMRNNKTIVNEIENNIVTGQ